MKLEIIGASLRNNLGVSQASGATPFKQFPRIHSLPDPQRLEVLVLLALCFSLTSDALLKRAAGLGHANRDSPETGGERPEKWCSRSEGPDHP